MDSAHALLNTCTMQTIPNFLSLFALLINVGVYAIPTPLPLHGRSGVVQLSAAQIAEFAPFTQFARAAYCDPSIITEWKCGG
jgi:hypothetical protein